MINEEANALMTPRGFDAEFFRNLATSKTHLEAYLKTEKKYKSYFGKTRYSSFDSYRKSRDQRKDKKMTF